MAIKRFLHISALLLGIFCPRIFAEKIVIFHHVATYSHRVQTWPIALELSKNNHEVTYVSPFHPKEPNPNITEIVPKEFEDFVKKFLSIVDISYRINNEHNYMRNMVFQMGHEACEVLYKSKEFKIWLGENPKADLVIVDNCLAECGVGLAHKLGAKYMYFSTVSVFPHEYDSLGFLPEASSIPEMEVMSYEKPLGYFKRISNAVESLRWRWAHFQYSKGIDKMIRKELNAPNMPYIEDLVRNTSLILHTGDVITDHARSLPPLYVNVAGIHCQNSMKALPEEIEVFIMSNSTERMNDPNPDDGFIYMSLGSQVVPSNLPISIQNVFFEVIRSFPHIKFLWRWNGPFPADIPENLMLAKWFPQIDVLGHPKIRGFITQSGRPSTLEALFNGVPMISLPVMGDQDFNGNRLHEMGAAIKLEIAHVTFEELKEAVNTILYDAKLKKRVSKLQSIFLDRPMSAIETAIWWIGYVLRMEDTNHLRPAGNDQYWFVRRQIDVWATLSIGVFVLVIGALVAVWKLLENFKTMAKLKND